MNKGSIKVLATIAVILQALTAAAGVVIVVLQKTVLRAFMNMPSDSMVTVFPLTLVFVFVQLIIYIAFFSISQKEGSRVMAFILIIFSVILAVVSVFGNMLASIFYSRQGVAAVGGYSGITTLISYVNTLFGVPANALFYIACGRYTAGSE